MNMVTWQNESWQAADAAPSVYADDGGWLFGDSLFETLLVRKGRALFLAEHLDRLELSARLLELPFARRSCEEQLLNALPAAPWDTARLRLTLSRGTCSGLAFPEQPGRLQITLAPYREPTGVERQQGWTCLTAPNRRVNPLSHLPQLKRGNYGDCLYAWNHARSHGCREALFASPGGEYLEGATSNLFVVHDGRLTTPPAGELVLAGVMRRLLLEIADKMEISCQVASVSGDDLAHAEEVFLCNSLVLVVPCAALDNRPLKRGRLWQSLLDELENRLAADSSAESA